MVRSIFLKKQGFTVRNKIMDFFITYSELDYSLKEISKFSEVGYSTVKLMMPEFVKSKWILPTRKISKIKLYKLNVKNPEVRKFVDFFWEVCETEIKKTHKIPEKQNYHSSRPIAVSARTN